MKDKTEREMGKGRGEEEGERGRGGSMISQAGFGRCISRITLIKT